MFTRVPDCMIAALEHFFSFTFHDAQLYSICADFAARTLTFDVACMHRQCDSQGEVLLEEYRRGRLVLRGLEYFRFDPDENLELEIFDSPETISEFLAEDPDAMPQDLPAEQPDGVVSYRVYFFSWNCFLHLAVREAEFVWTEPPRFSAWNILETITRMRSRIADKISPVGDVDPSWQG